MLVGEGDTLKVQKGYLHRPCRACSGCSMQWMQSASMQWTQCNRISLSLVQKGQTRD